MVAGLLALAVQASAVTAPMMHVHLDDHDSDDHHAREMHAHLSPHGHHAAPTIATGVPSLSEDEGDERVLSVSGFVATSVDSFPGVFAIPVEISIVVAEDRTLDRVPLVAHGHDPPELTSSSPRAPPFSPAC